MKKLALLVLGSSLALASTAALSESKIKDSEINLDSKVKRSAAVTLGEGSTASVGSVNIDDSKIKKSKINVNTKVKDSVAITGADDSTASVGSVTVK